MSETIYKGPRMSGIERTWVNQTTADVHGSPPGASTIPAVALIDEGNALEEKGRIPEAMARHDAAVQADPQCARAHLNRGNILAGAQFDEARSTHQLASQYAAVHFNLGNLNYRTLR
jgi:tetratricopeptide (TPR) repeat protein